MAISCKTCQNHLSSWLEYSDKEYSDVTPEFARDAAPDAMRAHLEACEECRRNFHLVRAARDEMRALPSLTAPADLRARVRQSLEAQSQKQPLVLPQTHSKSHWPEWLTNWRQPMRLYASTGAALTLLLVAMFAHLRTTPVSYNQVATPDAVVTEAESTQPEESARQDRGIASKPSSDKTVAAKPEAAQSSPAEAGPQESSASMETPTESEQDNSPRPSRPGRIAMSEIPDRTRATTSQAADGDMNEAPAANTRRETAPATGDAVPRRPEIATEQTASDPARQNIEAPATPSIAPQITAPRQDALRMQSDTQTLDGEANRAIGGLTAPSTAPGAQPAQSVQSAPPAPLMRTAPEAMRDGASGLRGPAGPAGPSVPAAPRPESASEAVINGFGIAGAAEAASALQNSTPARTPPKPAATPTTRPRRPTEAPSGGQTDDQSTPDQEKR